LMLSNGLVLGSTAGRNAASVPIIQGIIISLSAPSTLSLTNSPGYGSITLEQVSGQPSSVAAHLTIMKIA